jgi:SMI1 / KNR4 family (SUKH-1)
MTSDEWRLFLTEYNRELLEYPEELNNCPAEVAAAGWLGFPPASEEQIQATEARIGRRLPPSLRNFYAVTNGWRDLNIFLWDIFPVEKLDWLPAYYPNLFYDEEYLEQYLHNARDEQEREWTRQQMVYVSRSLVITDHGDAGFLLLDPERQNENGEWAAGHWASWNPAMDWETSSFAEQIQKERETWLRLRGT